jgi:hypothetical protein
MMPDPDPRYVGPDPDPEPVASADAAWEEMIADSLGYISTDAMLDIIARHRPAIEAAIRGTEAVDVERLTLALWHVRAGTAKPPRPESANWAEQREAAARLARAYADSEPS